MLEDFFKLNEPYHKRNEEDFLKSLETSKHIQDVLYLPDTLPSTLREIKEKIFENTSFSKTTLKNITFKKVKFIDCLFIGTIFDEVLFQGCTFENCNFFKCKINNIKSSNPKQFAKAIQKKNFANIATHLYHELRAHYARESQTKFRNEADYNFHKWDKELQIQSAKHDNEPAFIYYTIYLLALIKEILFAYGYRTINVVTTTILTILLFSSYHYLQRSNIFETITEKAPSSSWVESVYFVVTTMATLGASGQPNLTEHGYVFVTIMVITGVILITSTVNLIIKNMSTAR